jgi:hypothetical protein
MTGVPESPVREYEKRIVEQLAALRSKRALGGEWSDGFRAAVGEVISIIAEQAPLSGQETTRFEYRAAATNYNGQWRPAASQAMGEMEAFRRTGSYEDLRVERRTVTVTQPVRLDADGEPVQ